MIAAGNYFFHVPDDAHTPVLRNAFIRADSSARLSERILPHAYTIGFSCTFIRADFPACLFDWIFLHGLQRIGHDIVQAFIKHFTALADDIAGAACCETFILKFLFDRLQLKILNIL